MFRLPDESELDLELGRDLGYEYARYNLTIPENAPQAFMEGYLAQKHQNPYFQKIDSFARRVIRLRYSAWRRNRTFDPNITADYLRRITVNYCPVTRQPFTWGQRLDTDASVERATNNGGYAVGNILYISAKANKSKGGKSFADILEIYRSGKDYDGLTHAEWSRLLYLSYACDSTERGNIDERNQVFPMYMLIPDHVDVCNVACALQGTVAVCSISKYMGNSREFPRYQKAYSQLLSLGGKKSTKIFRSFSENYCGVLDRLYLKSPVKTRQFFEFAVADAWTEPITNLYVKWLSSLDDVSGSKILDALRTSKVNSDLTHWHLDTDGYAVPNFDQLTTL